MGCIKGKLRAKLEKGNFRCRKCGGCSRFKKDLCKAEYIDYSITTELIPAETAATAKDSKRKKKKKKEKDLKVRNKKDKKNKKKKER